MKNILSILVLLTLLPFFSEKASAQKEDFSTKADAELTEDQAKIRIEEFTLKVKDVQSRLNNITAEYDKLARELEEVNAKLKNCDEALFTAIGATADEVEKYRQKLGVVEGKIRAKQKLSAEALSTQKEELFAIQNELKDLTKSKISLLPDIYSRITGLAKDVKGLFNTVNSYKPVDKDKYYVVGTWEKDRDCLWNIAGKLDIYGDPFKWTKLWLANPDMIRNPDIIHPGQKLKVPATGPTSNDESKKLREYWRKKRAAQQRQLEESGKRGE